MTVRGLNRSSAGVPVLLRVRERIHLYINVWIYSYAYSYIYVHIFLQICIFLHSFLHTNIRIHVYVHDIHNTFISQYLYTIWCNWSKNHLLLLVTSIGFLFLLFLDNENEVKFVAYSHPIKMDRFR
jgi:hypothetical protein